VRKIGTVTPGYVPALPMFESTERTVEQFRREVSEWQIHSLNRQHRDGEAYETEERFRLMGML